MEKHGSGLMRRLAARYGKYDRLKSCAACALWKKGKVINIYKESNGNKTSASTGIFVIADGWSQVFIGFLGAHLFLYIYNKEYLYRFQSIIHLIMSLCIWFIVMAPDCE